MKKIKKLNQAGVTHLVIPALALVVMAGAGALVYLHQNHVDTSKNTALAAPGFADVHAPDGGSSGASGVCGKGYTRQGSGALFGPGNKRRSDIGSLQVFRKSTVGADIKYCGIVVSGSATKGTVKPMDVEVNVYLSVAKKDSGSYKTYAGPIYYQPKGSVTTGLSFSGGIKYKGHYYSLVYNF